jgi:molybdopterin-guanine dinucleotide biosynthesis adapter protein
MIPVIGICGLSGSGKTTLLEGVIQQLVQRGLKVGAVKHHGHGPGLTPPDPPKDSDRLAAAGAEPVALLHAGGLVLSRGADAAGWGPAAVAHAYFVGLDIVVAEGFKNAGIPKIEVVAPGKDPVLPKKGRLLATAGRNGWGRVDGLDFLNADDPAWVAEYILGKIKVKDAPKHKVSVEFEGRALDINPFVQNILAGAVNGLIDSLKGMPTEGRVVITIDRSTD